jgi:hypothetical protein
MSPILKIKTTKSVGSTRITERHTKASPDIPKWSASLVEAANKPGLIIQGLQCFSVRLPLFSIGSGKHSQHERLGEYDGPSGGFFRVGNRSFEKSI